MLFFCNNYGVDVLPGVYRHCYNIMGYVSERACGLEISNENGHAILKRVVLLS